MSLDDQYDRESPGLTFDLFTLFPEMFSGPFGESIVLRATTMGAAAIHIHDIRKWTHDRHRTVDDRPYGGGAGMVMMAPPIVEAVESVLEGSLADARILVMSPGGRPFHQDMARELAREGRLALICGHYEGIDERVTEILNAEPVSVGDYVLTGGELPAMVIVDAVIRLLPGVIDPQSTAEESHNDGLVEYPQYTRPADYRGLPVPDVLLSGHHEQIRQWRLDAARARTRERDAGAASSEGDGDSSG